MTDVPEEPGQGSKSGGASKPRGSRYRWIEREILLKCVAPKIEQSVNRHNPQSYRELGEAMRNDWGCTASDEQIKIWLKALGYEMEKVTHLVARKQDGSAEGRPKPDPAGPDQVPTRNIPPHLGGQRPRKIPDVGGLM